MMSLACVVHVFAQRLRSSPGVGFLVVCRPLRLRSRQAIALQAW
jgi:hypothetical protein